MTEKDKLEIEYLKSLTYTEINEKFNQLKDIIEHQKKAFQKTNDSSGFSEWYNNGFKDGLAHKKIDLIKEYLDPTGITITELIDRNAFASLCQLLDAYLLEAVRNSH